jgi:hypothetical protein
MAQYHIAPVVKPGQKSSTLCERESGYVLPLSSYRDTLAKGTVREFEVCQQCLKKARQVSGEAAHL